MNRKYTLTDKYVPAHKYVPHEGAEAWTDYCVDVCKSVLFSDDVALRLCQRSNAKYLAVRSLTLDAEDRYRCLETIENLENQF